MTARNTPIAAAMLLLTALACGVGCGHRKVAAIPPPLPDGGEALGYNLQESLFKGDQAVLSNQDIERILSGHVSLENRHRLAVLGLRPRSIWSAELAAADAEHADRFLQVLKSAPRMSQVRMMPALLIPERRTVPFLREAAARFQADLLLVYTTRIETFRRDRFIGADEVRANCMAEAVLLDVRTGIVIHTAQATEAIAAKKAPGDLSLSETMARAESEATGKALLKVAGTVAEYLRAGA